MPPVVLDSVSGEQAAQQGDRLGEARAALLDRHPAGLVFAGKLAADPDPENQPAFAQMVERGNLLGDRHRVAQREEVDPDPEQQPAADHGGLRQLQERVEDRGRVPDMVGDPDRIIAAAVDLADQRVHLVDHRQPWPDGRLGAAVDRLEADLEGGVERQIHDALLDARHAKMRYIWLKVWNLPKADACLTAECGRSGHGYDRKG
jgi:hypothetical protein